MTEGLSSSERARANDRQRKQYAKEAPKYDELECRTRDLTFSKPLYVWVELLIKETGEIQRQRVLPLVSLCICELRCLAIGGGGVLQLFHAP